MPFRGRWTPRARADFDALRAAAEAALRKSRASRGGKGKKPRKSPAIGRFRQVEKCVRLLLQDPRHPGLHTHEFHSLENPFDPAGKVFEAYVQNDTPAALRLFWCYGPTQGEITVIAITAHP